MIKRFLAPTAVLGLGLLLGSCSSFSASVADHWPQWAGGMPDDVPPRPGAPGYAEFIAHNGAVKDATAPAAAAPAAAKANVQPAPAANPPVNENRPANDQNAVQGGLY